MLKSYKIDNQFFVMPELEDLLIMELEDVPTKWDSAFKLRIMTNNGTWYSVFLGHNREFAQNVFDMISDDLSSHEVIDLDVLEEQGKIWNKED